MKILIGNVYICGSIMYPMKCLVLLLFYISLTGCTNGSSILKDGFHKFDDVSISVTNDEVLIVEPGTSGLRIPSTSNFTYSVILYRDPEVELLIEHNQSGVVTFAVRENFDENRSRRSYLRTEGGYEMDFI